MAQWSAVTKRLSLKTCVILYGVTISCLLLVGPGGPCGPDSVLGFILLMVGMPLALCAGLLTALSLIASAVHRESRRRAILAMAVTGVIIALLTSAYQLAHPDPADVVYAWSLGTWAWLGLSAVACLIPSATASVKSAKA